MRWVISPIIGNGTSQIIEGSEATTGPYRAAVGAYGPYAALIPGNNDGTPKKSWALVYFGGDAAQIAAAEADGAIRVFPAGLTEESVLTAPQANVFNNYLDNYGINNVLSAGMTGKQAIEAIAHEVDPTFSYNGMKVN
jgi:hypothetical protein